MNHKIADGWAVLALIAAAACWGGATVMTKSVLATIPPFTLFVVQLGTSVCLLWLFVWLNNAWPTKATHLLPLGLIGLLNPGVSYTLNLLGLTMTSASVSSLLWATEPVLILLLAWLVLGERLTASLIAYSVLALTGAVVIGGATPTSGDLYGSSLIFLGILCCTPYTVLMRRLGAENNPLFVTALQQSVALLWGVVIWFFELRQTGIAPLANLPPSAWFYAGVAGILYYALAYCFYLQGLSHVSAGVAGACLNLIPVFGVSGAFIFLDERLTLTQWLGAGAILLAVYAIFFLPGKAAKSTADRAAVLPT